MADVDIFRMHNW